MTQAQTASYNPTIVAEEIRLSDTAGQQMAVLMQSADEAIEGVRVFVTGGGCNGFSYGFTFDDDVAEDDATVENDGVAMVIDAMSYPYLEGSQVDYVEDLNGSQFVVTNPNAQSTCGCGNSFAI